MSAVDVHSLRTAATQLFRSLCTCVHGFVKMRQWLVSEHIQVIFRARRCIQIAQARIGPVRLRCLYRPDDVTCSNPLHRSQAASWTHLYIELDASCKKCSVGSRVGCIPLLFQTKISWHSQVLATFKESSRRPSLLCYQVREVAA